MTSTTTVSSATNNNNNYVSAVATNTTTSNVTEDIMCITPIGSGQEVGRSCHLIEFCNIRILCDVGIHPGYEGINGLPFFDRIDSIETIDIILISHFHLDHVAALPYFTERTAFKGKIYMTYPTKAVTRLLLGDYIRLLQMRHNNDNNKDSADQSTDMLYTEKELNSCLNKVECIDYHTVIHYYQQNQNKQTNNNSASTTTSSNNSSNSNTSSSYCTIIPYYAGHVLGACMFYITIAGRTILYTGDYSMEQDRHLKSAEIPYQITSSGVGSGNNATTSTDVLIVESTYGVQVHSTRIEREIRFTSTIEKIVTRGGKCLIPVFALGRAQELLLILDEYWQANKHLHNIPIWYASKLASRALRVYQTYSNMMNIHIQQQMDIKNPFHFQYIQNLKSINVNTFDNDNSPCVVFASPGMLQSGVSRQLFDKWASDPKNGVLIAGYAVDHTLAKEIMSQPKEVMTLDGRKQPLNCLVDYVSFSAHVDFVQNRSFITKVAPKHIVLVHGQKDEMGRLKSALMLQYKHYPESKRPTITMPPNQVEVKLKFTRRRSAKVMGQLASGITTSSNENDDNKQNIRQSKLPEEGDVVNGIMVTQNFQSKIVTPADIATYTPLRVGMISSKLHVPFAGSIDTLQLFLREMFAGIVEQPIGDSDNNADVTTSTNSNDYAQQPLENEISDIDSRLGSAATKPTMYTLHNGEVRIIMGVQRHVIIVEWQASPAGDILADSVVALIMHAQSSAASIRYTSKPCHHPRDIESSNADQEFDDASKKIKRPDDLVSDRLRFVRTVLLEQFQHVEAIYDAFKGTYNIVIDGAGTDSTGVGEDRVDGTGASSSSSLQCQVMVEFDDALANTAKITVECQDSKIASNVQTTLQNAVTAAAAVPS